jgi:segregation and condensation protein A
MDEKEVDLKENPVESMNVKQEQLHDILFSREIGWQDIIYDLINTEQLDPWDIDISVLAGKYLEKIRVLEEDDFFISSKVLLAASLLLRIKSELLLNKYVRSIDDILFGKKEKKEFTFERIELNEEIPELIPRSPLPRFRKVTLTQLIESLGKAINTENKRIRKEIINKNALRETSFSLPRRKFSITDKINEIFMRITKHFSSNKEHKKISYTMFVGENKEERIDSFSPLLHLDNQKRVWLEQEAPFDEIHIWLRNTFMQNNPHFFDDLMIEQEDEPKKRGRKKKIEEAKNGTEKSEITDEKSEEEVEEYLEKEDEEGWEYEEDEPVKEEKSKRTSKRDVDEE